VLCDRVTSEGATLTSNLNIPISAKVVELWTTQEIDIH